MIPQPTSDLLGGTISDDLDKIEILVGKIGFNTREQTLQVLYSLDVVSAKMSRLENGQSLKTARAQYEGILAKLDKEASGFLRDLGGVQVLRQTRSQVNPPKDHSWWYLDVSLAQRRNSSIKRLLITAGAILVLLVVLGFVYQTFLAPAPEVAERYSREQAAGDALIAGDLEKALKEAEAGLLLAPQDAGLLILKGVILDGLGKSGDAQVAFEAAQKVLPNQEEFLITRGQHYSMSNQLDKALSDATDVLRLNPESAQAYLLIGQVYEIQKDYQKALDAYDQAYTISDKQKQYEMAALARMRMAMLMQVMNVQITPPDWMLTPTPTP